MVGLSAKAFRFAEDATHALIVTHLLQDRSRETWERWVGEDHAAEGRPGYVDVPDGVAAVMRRAVEMRVDQMQRHFARDDDLAPDLGNDLAFLRNVLVARHTGGPEAKAGS